MGSYVWTTFSIGGQLKRDDLEMFRELTSSLTEHEIIENVVRDGETFSCNGECRNGDFDELEHFLQDKNLSYIKTFDGEPGSFNSGGEIWVPGWEVSKTYQTNNDGMRVIEVVDLRAWDREGRTLKELIATLEIPTIPPLTMLSEMEEKVEEVLKK